jgi:hypothetical protein
MELPGSKCRRVFKLGDARRETLQTVQMTRDEIDAGPEV